MKKLFIFFISFIWLGNLPGQNWVNMIDSMPLSNQYFEDGVVDPASNTLYLAGFFNKLNNLQTKSVIKYDGVKFDTLGAGLDPQWKNLVTPTIVKKTIMFQNKLYVTGQFEKAGKYYTHNIARWNGTDWDTINFRLNGTAWHMQVYNNELYVGGLFDSIAGMKCNNFAKYDGVNWHSISYPYNTCVSAIEIYDGKLYMAGEVSSGSSCTNLAYYDGAAWVPWFGVSGSTTKTVWGMKTIDTMLFVYGRFYGIGGINCNGLMAWNGKKWFDYGLGTEKSGTIRDISKIDGELYISGIFDSINDVSTNNGLFNFRTSLGKFDGSKFCTVMEPFNNPVDFTIKYNNDIYFAGAFTEVGNNIPVMPLLKWTGGNSTISCGAVVGVGINEHTISESIKIYPNPTSSILNIEDEQNELQNSSIEITNSIGQSVIQIPFNSTIDVSNLPKGCYFITITTLEKSILRTKFIKG